MAKQMFYSSEEAAKRLRSTPDGLKALVRDGKLREFRDAGKSNYKIDDVDALVASLSPAKPTPVPVSGKTAAGASASGEIVLEPVEDSGVELAPMGSGELSIETEADAADTRIGAKASKKAKEGSSIPSVGINVFDDDELDQVVDPLAQTAVSDVAGLGLEGIGGGSGILDLTRESDDTSLGAELLDEIYTDDDARKAPAKKKEEAEDTRAGLAAATDDESGTVDQEDFLAGAEEEADAAAGKRRATVLEVVEYAPDAVSTSLTALLVVAVAVMWLAGLAGAALVRGVSPGLVHWLYANMAIFLGGAVVVAGAAAGVTYFLVKRAES